MSGGSGLPTIEEYMAEYKVGPSGQSIEDYMAEYNVDEAEDATVSKPAAQPRTVFISLSTLLRKPWAALSKDPRLSTSLFFFGSKRSWIFPATEAEREESQRNNPAYMQMPTEMRACIIQKEAAGLVFWLKPDDFVYDGGLYSGDPTAFPRASEWLQKLRDPVTNAPYKPLQLDPEWWRGGTWSAKHTSKVENIVRNLQNGAHDYKPVCELLVQSNENLVPALE